MGRSCREAGWVALGNFYVSPHPTATLPLAWLGHLWAQLEALPSSIFWYKMWWAAAPARDANGFRCTIVFRNCSPWLAEVLHPFVL